MGSEDDTPFARVPEPIDGPYEPGSPYTIEGQIDQYGQLARGARRSPYARIVVAAFVLTLLGLMLYGLIAPLLSR